MNPEMAMSEFLKKLSPELMSDRVSVRASLSNVPWYFPIPYILVFLYCLHGTSAYSGVYDIIKYIKISRMHLKDRKKITVPGQVLLILRFSEKECIVLGVPEIKLRTEIIYTFLHGRVASLL
jgi:hypothetical protein